MLVLSLASAFRICSGKDGGWVVTARAASEGGPAAQPLTGFGPDFAGRTCENPSRSSSPPRKDKYLPL